MQARIAELKNNLSRLLREMAASGQPITVLDRNTPIAKIIPLGPKARPSVWDKERAALERRAERFGIRLTTSRRDPAAVAARLPKAAVAPDGRRDVATVPALRSERDY
jgi:prevent-host-death family protein